MDLNLDNKRYPKGYEPFTSGMNGASAPNIGCYALTDPHANCQTFSIGSLNNAFVKYQTNKHDRTRTSDPFIFDYESIAYVFLKFQHMCGKKPQVLIDIHDFKEYHQIIDEIFKDNIVVKTPYLSTNNSKMCLYLLKLQGAKNYVENIETQRKLEAKRLAEEEKARKIASGEWKEPDFKLPEKWFIVATKDTTDSILDWYCNLKGYKKTSMDKSPGNYYTSSGRAWMYTAEPKENYVKDHVELTFEQFVEHVFNKQEKLAAETVDNSNLPF